MDKKTRHGHLKPIGNAINFMDGSTTSDISERSGSSLVPMFSKSSRKRAKTAALFYGECYLQGIPPDAAESAVTESQACYSKWWLQNRFKPGFEKVDTNNAIKDHGNATTTTQISSSGHLLNSDGKRKDESSSVGDRDYERKRREIGEKPCSISSKAEYLCDERNNNEETVVSISDEEADFVVDTSDHGIPASLSTSAKNLDDSNGDKLAHRLDKRKAKIRKGKVIKQRFLKELIESEGVTTSKEFAEVLDDLSSFNRFKTMEDVTLLDGVWLTMSNPDFPESLGNTENGDFMYTLGRMSFDMFRPQNLKCSIQGMFNRVGVTDDQPSSIPRSLQKDIKAGKYTVRTYNIVVAFTIEPDHKSKIKHPVRGVMTSYGFIIPDPEKIGRFTVWFSGGVLEPNDETELHDWMEIFREEYNSTNIQQKAKLLASKVLLGVQVQPGISTDGSMSYHLTKPIGGHGLAFFDVVYCDKSLRVIRGHKGTIYVLSRVPMA